MAHQSTASMYDDDIVTVDENDTITIKSIEPLDEGTNSSNFFEEVPIDSSSIQIANDTVVDIETGPRWTNCFIPSYTLSQPPGETTLYTIWQYGYQVAGEGYQKLCNWISWARDQIPSREPKQGSNILVSTTITNNNNMDHAKPEQKTETRYQPPPPPPPPETTNTLPRSTPPKTTTHDPRTKAIEDSAVSPPPTNPSTPSQTNVYYHNSSIYLPLSNSSHPFPVNGTVHRAAWC